MTKIYKPLYCNLYNRQLASLMLTDSVIGLAEFVVRVYCHAQMMSSVEESRMCTLIKKQRTSKRGKEHQPIIAICLPFAA